MDRSEWFYRLFNRHFPYEKTSDQDNLFREIADFVVSDDSDILVSAQPSVLGAVTYAVTPDDPRYAEQWALANSRQTGGTRNVDIGAEDVFPGSQQTFPQTVHSG